MIETQGSLVLLLNDSLGLGHIDQEPIHYGHKHIVNISQHHHLWLDQALLRERRKGSMGGWMGRWMGRWMEGWMKGERKGGRGQCSNSFDFTIMYMYMHALHEC